MRNIENIFFDPDELLHCGDQVILGKTVRIRKPERVSIGDHTIIDDFTYISCGLTVGHYTHIGALAALIGGKAHITIGDFVNIAPGSRLICASHDFSQGGLTGPAIPPEYASPAVEDNIKLDDHVLLGANTTVLPGVHVPEGVATGAATLLTAKTELEPWYLYVGIPARRIRIRERQVILNGAKRLLSERTGD